MKNVFTLLSIAGVAVSSLAQAAPHGILWARAIQAHRTQNHNGPSGERASRLQYYGGPVISNAKVYAVMWGSKVDSTTQSQIGDFYAATLNSSYMDWLKEYNTSIKAVDGRDGTHQQLGRGAFEGKILLTPSQTKTRLDDKDIQAELDAQITAGNLPKPDANTLFMIYFPAGISITIDGQGSCSAFCAYHEGFVSPTHGNVYYGVMPDLGGMCSLGCGFQHTRFDSLTDVSAHELIEAVTDPFPTPKDKPAFPQAWNTTSGEEIGDLCSDSSGQLKTQGQTYIVQGEFDNSVNSCKAGVFQSP